jgi:myo-inositol-1(or 4)-monophosphatase
MMSQPLSQVDPALLAGLRALAEDAARIGGAVARRMSGADFAVRKKQDGSDVTEADLAAQHAAIDAIRQVRPDDAFVCEEADDAGSRTVSKAGSGACWVIDPIDGTRNYVHGIPMYACSVGVLWDGTPVAGAIYQPVTRELYSADDVGGATFNGRAIESRDVSPRRPIVAVPSTLTGWASTLVSQMPRRPVIRNTGSTTLHLAMLAAGQIQGVIARDAKIWDLAAGHVIVRAAGATMTGLNGDALFPASSDAYGGADMPAIAGVASVHAELLRGAATTGTR